MRRRGARSAGAARRLIGRRGDVYVYLQRTADGRDRDRRARRALPLRLAHRRRRGDGRSAQSTNCARASSRCSRRSRASRSSRPGRACSASRATGVRSSRPTPSQRPRLGRRLRRRGSRGERTSPARTLRDLILGEESELTRLSWVGRSPRTWEPEPLRWAAIRVDLRALPARRPRRARAAAGARASASLRRSRVGPRVDGYDRPPDVFETLLYTTDGPIATITLNRPERLNTIVPPMPDELEDAVAAGGRRRAT